MKRKQVQKPRHLHFFIVTKIRNTQTKSDM